jgi:hypothetical protein
VAPRDLALSRPSPRGKKNSRGAPRLRQIERANSALTQVRHAVMGRSHRVVPLASAGAPRDEAKIPGRQNATLRSHYGASTILRERGRGR